MSKMLSIKNTSKSILIPCTIFQNRKLSMLENVVRYLNIETSSSTNEIANLLGKKESNIRVIISKIKTKTKMKRRTYNK